MGSVGTQLESDDEEDEEASFTWNEVHTRADETKKKPKQGTAGGAREGDGVEMEEAGEQQKRKKNKGSLKQSFVQLNKDMSLLQNYCILNYTAYVKITKKHDKAHSHLQQLRNRSQQTQSS